jgi:alpha-methylacyl-CoA racemase
VNVPRKRDACGPLKGLKVIEMAGIGPAPFCAMMLSDMGAEVIRLCQKRKPGTRAHFAFANPQHDVLARGRRSLALDLKKAEGQQVALRLIEQADALIEGFRPGVMERLNLSPEVCMGRNPKLVYGRMTGWGQTGPLAHSAGHDINYIALTGVLNAIGSAGETPTVPLNLIGDFGGGAMMLAFGLVCALLEAKSSGQGQIIDAAIVDGTAVLSVLMHSFKAARQWTNARATNLLDGGAPFYSCYACADGNCIALGALEPQFYGTLCKLLGLTEADLPGRDDSRHWPELRNRFAGIFRTRTRDQWCELLEGTDACFAPILNWDEASGHPHNQARKVFIEIDGVTQPAPAPRFSRTPAAVQGRAARDGENSESILADWGCSAEEIGALRVADVI